MDYRRLFAVNLRAAREARDLSQEQLARKARLHRCRVDSIERGKRNVDLANMVRLARALGLEAADLLRHKRA
jgi:transcriptional regulator with XRE-family HTH domain